MDAENKSDAPKGFSDKMKQYVTKDAMCASPLTTNERIRNARRALLRSQLADLAVAMAESESEIAYCATRELFELTLKQYRVT